MTTNTDTSEHEQLRRDVLDALQHFECPVAPHQELRPFLEGVHGARILAADLDRLIQIEQEAFGMGQQRPIWLCFGIRPDLSGDPGVWTRSDWPLWWRVFISDDEKVRRYWLLRQLFRSPVQRTNPRQPFPEPIAQLYLQLAEQLPASKIEDLQRRLEQASDHDYDWERDRWEIWCAIAEELFDELADSDRQHRQQIAGRVAQLEVAAQLWGTATGSNSRLDRTTS